MAEPTLFDSVTIIKSPHERICHCGKEKDYRAAQCRSCANREQALRQWANPISRTRIKKGLKKAGEQRRIRYSDLNFESFVQQKMKDRRFYAWYWDCDERHRAIYRYQWVWEKSNGPIPDQMSIHHKNHDCTDDRIENLQLMTHSDHAKYHGALKTSRAPWWICLRCGKSFQKRKREGIEDRKYCSRICQNRAMGDYRRGKFKPGSRRYKAEKRQSSSSSPVKE